LPADEKFIARRLRYMVRCAGNVHRRILEQDKSDVSQRSGFNFGVKSLTTIRLRGMADEIVAGDAVPIVKPISRMHVRR
jgi:hypothetical protein